MEKDKIYDDAPIYSEALQNYGKDDLDDMSLEELIDEYKSALKEAKELEEEIKDLEGTKANKYPVEERLQNTKRYIERIEGRLKANNVSSQKMESIKESVLHPEKKREEG